MHHNIYFVAKSRVMLFRVFATAKKRNIKQHHKSVHKASTQQVFDTTHKNVNYLTLYSLSNMI
jgi:hypothetical protein